MHDKMKKLSQTIIDVFFKNNSLSEPQQILLN
jgi:hypothetical protein